MRRSLRRRILTVMTKRTICVEVELNGEPLHGSVSVQGGSARRFSSWLGLLAALDALVAGFRSEAQAEGADDGPVPGSDGGDDCTPLDEPEQASARPAARDGRKPTGGGSHAA